MSIHPVRSVPRVPAGSTRSLPAGHAVGRVGGRARAYGARRGALAGHSPIAELAAVPAEFGQVAAGVGARGWFASTGIYLLGACAGIAFLAFVAVIALSQGLGR